MRYFGEEDFSETGGECCCDNDGAKLVHFERKPDTEAVQETFNYLERLRYLLLE